MGNVAHIKICDEHIESSLRQAQDERVGEPRDWFTAAELADLALPGLPADKRALNRRIRDERWEYRPDADGEPLARPSGRRGGGREYHVSLLPGAARIELARRGLCETRPEPELAESPAAGSWRWYDLQTDKVKAVAERRAAIVGEVELLKAAAMTGTAAVAEAARLHGVGKATLWSWLALIDGVARSDWLPALAPHRVGGGREAEIHPLLWQTFASDFLRASEPTLASCYDRVAAIAKERGIPLPSQVTFRRRADREFPDALRTLRRKGEEALRRSIPAQRRTVDHLHALELVNIDGHKFDNRVIPPPGLGWKDGKTVRPIMVAIQDIYSSRVLAWCIDLSENAIQTQIVFGKLFREYGLPKGVLLDNGRAFASKKISGGAPTRFRFKIRDDEPTGVLMALDINPQWALPYRGQSKPIERAFRDMCDRIARHPAMEGAYTGNSPVNKPHNYGSRAIPWDEFVAHVDRGIAAHNAKAGRRGRHYAGRSFDQVFAESYATAPIRKATPEQLRRALLTATPKTVNRQTGEIALFGNRYWTPMMSDLRGQRVIVRFDPENLHSEIYLYGLDGRFLLAAPVWEDVGFDSEAGAKKAAKMLADYRKLAREQEEMADLVDAARVAAMQPDAPEFTLPENKVTRMARHRGQTAAALKAVPAPAPKQHETTVFAALGKLRAVE